MRVRPIIAALTLVMLAGALLTSRAAQAGPAVLVDAKDGRILYAEDLDAEWHPASLTKIMTAYLTFEAVKQGKLQLDQRITYSALAAEQPPSKIGLNVGAQLTVDSALKALIIKSGNDIAVMLAEAVAGSQPAFVALMNNTAQRLGMERTNFVNPNGLPALQQVTTARDLAKLARAVVADYPEYLGYWSMNDARIGRIYLVTHNGLLNSFEGADGLKTGFTCDSGFNLVASATRDNRRLIAVVLGAATGAERTLRAASLLEHGFQEIGWKEMFATTTLDTAPVDAGPEAVTSVRSQVISAECGTGRRGSRFKGKNRKPKPVEASITAPAKADSAKTPASSDKPADKPAKKAKTPDAKSTDGKTADAKPADAKTATASAKPADGAGQAANAKPAKPKAKPAPATEAAPAKAPTP